VRIDNGPVWGYDEIKNLGVVSTPGKERRRFMKRFLTITATLAALMAALCVTASASDFDAAAQELSGIGMFQGTASGFELDRAPTRSEAAIMLTRLFGAENEAKTAWNAGELKHPFTDVSATASPYVAWVYNKGLSNGVTSTTFGSANPCSAKNYTVFLLRALGYKDGVDFQYADAESFAVSKGLFDTSMLGGSFLRDDLAALTYQALGTNSKDGDTYLLANLVKSGAIDADKAKGITGKIDAYRTLNASSQQSMDMDFTMKMDMDMDATILEDGTTASETENASVTASGSAQVVLADQIQMAMEMKMNMAMDGEQVDTDMGVWLKDGKTYVRSGDEAYQQDLGGQLDELMDFAAGANANAMLLPYIDSITTAKSGADTVYTMTLNNAFSGLVQDIVALVTPMPAMAGANLDMDVDIGGFQFIYTLDKDAELKSAKADGVMEMKMDMAMAPQNTMTVTVKLDMDMDMTIKAVGDAVKVTYPDFSGFQEMPAGIMVPAA